MNFCGDPNITLVILKGRSSFHKNACDKFLSIPRLLKIHLVIMVEKSGRNRPENRPEIDRKIEKSWTVRMLERTVECIAPASIDSYDDCNGNGMLTSLGTGTLNTYLLAYTRDGR